MPAHATISLPPRWALLVVDMQNDFLDAGGYYAQRAVLEAGADWAALSSEAQRRLLEEATRAGSQGARADTIARVVANIRTAVATARAARRPIAYIRAAYDPQHAIRPPLLLNDPARRHFPCKPGTWGAGFFGAIADAVGAASGPSERIIEKHTYDAFSNPALLAFLQDSKASAVVVSGTETQVCVLATAQHAAQLGFRSFILEDGVWSANREVAAAALTLFRDAYGGTLTVRDLGATVPD